MTSRLTRVNGVLKIDIDGQIYEPLSFKSFRPTAKNISDFHKAGVKLFSILSTGLYSILGVPYSLYGESWIGDGQYDFSPIDRQMEMFLENAPEGYFAPMFQIDTRPWYLEADKNRPNSFTNLSQIAGDPQFREDTADYLRAVVRHCEETYGDRIWGYFLLGGTTTEWFSDFDYEAPHPIKEAAYRRYCGDDSVTLPAEDRLNRAGGVFLEPDEADIVHFRKFHANLISDLIISCASAVQDVIDHKKLLGLYFGYLFELGSPRLHNAGHLAYEKVFSSPDIDMISSPSSYAYRGVFDPSAFMLPQKSLDCRNKLYFLEFDHRTHTIPTVIHEPVVSAGGNMIYDSLHFPGSESKCKNETESLNLMYRDFVFCEANGAALWWFDMLDGWFRSEGMGMMKAIAHMMDIDRRLADTDRISAAEIAVIAEGESMFHVRKSSPIASQCLSDIRRTLAEVGAPYDLYSVSDLTKPELARYSFYIFLNQYDMTAETRAAVERTCKQRGKTVLWLYAPDYAVNGENDPARISDITGMTVRESPEDHGKLVWLFQTFSGTAAPYFHIDDPAAQVIAEFEDGCAAVAETSVNGCRSIYAALYRLPSGLLRTLADESGIFLYSNDPQVYTYANTSFLGVYTASDHDAAVFVREPGVYRDLIEGGIYRTKYDGMLTLPLKPIRAYLLLREDS